MNIIDELLPSHLKYHLLMTIMIGQDRMDECMHSHTLTKLPLWQLYQVHRKQLHDYHQKENLIGLVADIVVLRLYCVDLQDDLELYCLHMPHNKEAIYIRALFP